MEIMEKDVGRLFDPELFGYFREIVDLRVPAHLDSLSTEDAALTLLGELTLQYNG